jgi:hypothetical protein
MAATLDASPAPTAAPTQAPPAAPRRSYWQFSLFSLLLLVVIGCLVGAWLGERRQRREAEDRLKAKEAENRQYRIDLGLLDDAPGMLVISDPQQVHLRQLPSFKPRHWRWRLYLPPGRQWRLATSQGEVWDETRSDFRGSGSGTSFDERGEITLEGGIMRDEDGRTHVQILWGDRGSAAWIPDAGMRVLESNGQRTMKIGGSPKQESLPPSARVELLRWHVALSEGDNYLQDTTPVGQRIPPRSYGISMYLEEVHPNDPLYGKLPKPKPNR